MSQIQIHSLKHVSSAIEDAERFAEEAEELGQLELAKGLSFRAHVLSQRLDEALLAHEKIGPAREMRLRAHLALSNQYAEMTWEIESQMPPARAARLNPGSHLDVVERARFRLRYMMEMDKELAPLAAKLQAALRGYERAVDAYLMAAGESAYAKERALTDSQTFRLALEHTKLKLLNQAEVGSAAWKRIKRRTVRTKRARWLVPDGSESASPSLAHPLSSAA